MAIKIIHTADWHLGHQLHGFAREHEHQAFLDWLLALIETEQADALLVSGDLFDTANPAASSWKMLYHFMAALYKKMPKLNVIILGGNHDSPSKLNAPHELLKAFDLHMLGSVSRHADGELMTEQLIVPITNCHDEVEAWVMAVPFLRVSDLTLPAATDDNDRLAQGVRLLYEQVLAAALACRQPQQALIAMGHLFMAAGDISEMSERRILGGNQHALAASIFAPEIDYVALGHLHKAQRVAKQQHIRYSGSAIPLSISERHYQHQVLSVSFAEGKLTDVVPHLVPRLVELVRMPERHLPLDEVLAVLNNWQPAQREPELQPIVEVPVLLNAPEPLLREKIQQALFGKAVRLARIDSKYSRDSQPQLHAKTLHEVTPLDVFRFGWQRKYADEPPKEMQDAFLDLEAQVIATDEEQG